MNVYPNPVQTTLNIGNVTSLFEYTVTSMNGKMLMSGQLNATNATIDMSNVANGTYIVQLKNTQNAFTYRVIK